MNRPQASLSATSASGLRTRIEPSSSTTVCSACRWLSVGNGNWVGAAIKVGWVMDPDGNPVELFEWTGPGQPPA